MLWKLYVWIMSFFKEKEYDYKEVVMFESEKPHNIDELSKIAKGIQTDEQYEKIRKQL